MVCHADHQSWRREERQPSPFREWRKGIILPAEAKGVLSRGIAAGGPQLSGSLPVFTQQRHPSLHQLHRQQSQRGRQGQQRLRGGQVDCASPMRGDSHDVMKAPGDTVAQNLTS